MERNFEYQNTRTFDRDVFNAMFRVHQALSDDDECPDRHPAHEVPCTEPAPLSVSGALAGDQFSAPIGDNSQSPAMAMCHESSDGEIAETMDRQALDAAAHDRLSEARRLHEQAVAIRRRLLGDADPWLPQSMTWLGNLAVLEGHLDEAQWLYTQALEIVEKRHGPEHPARATPLHNLAVVARRRGDLDKAADLYDQTLAIKLEHHGWMHPSVASTLTNLGNLAHKTGDLRAAVCYFARAREIFEQTTGSVSPGLAAALIGLGRMHLAFGVHVSAAYMFERALRICEAIGVTPDRLAHVRRLLASALEGTRS